MAFFWLLTDPAGGDAGRSREFDDAEAAEAWLIESWAELRERGVESVALHDDAGERYRMSLADPEPNNGGS